MRDVTICVLSCIEPPLSECLAAVEAQEGGPYRVIHVKDVVPLYRAFNQMVQDCQSRLIVQIDGDVVVEPWAVRVLAASMGSWTYVVWGQLLEADGFGLGGSVRCWWRPPVNLFRFRDKRCTDRDLHARLSLIGLRRLQAEPNLIFGLHKPRASPFARYSKAHADVEKWRVLGRWDLTSKVNKGADDEWTREGVEDGLATDLRTAKRSKDAGVLWRKFLSHQSTKGRNVSMRMRAEDEAGQTGS